MHHSELPPRFTTTTDADGNKRHRFEAIEDDSAFGIPIDFEGLLREKSELEQAVASPEEIQRLSEKIDDYYIVRYGEVFLEKTDEDFKPHLERIAREIKEQQLVQSELEDLMDISALPDVAAYIAASPYIQLGRDRELPPTVLAAHQKGGITVNPELLDWAKPTPAIYALAQIGLPNAQKILFHESVHRVQPEPVNTQINLVIKSFLGSAAVFAAMEVAAPQHTMITLPAILLYLTGRFGLEVKKVSDQRKDSALVREAQAYLADAELWDANYLYTRSMISLFMKSPLYGIQDPKFIDHIISATQQLSRLRAMKVPHKTIAEFVGHAKWHEATHSYDTLDDAVQQVLEQTNLRPEQLDGYVDAARIQRQIRVLRLRQLGQQALELVAQKIAG